MNDEKLRDGAYGLSSLSEKTRESNHLQANDQGRVVIIVLTFQTKIIWKMISEFQRIPGL